MKIKRIRRLKVNTTIFNVQWNDEHNGGHFNYGERDLEIGTSDDEESIFMILCHELMEVVAIEMHVRLNRTDCASDYVFVYDHRQHTTMMEMFAGLLSQFIK